MLGTHSQNVKILRQTSYDASQSRQEDNTVTKRCGRLSDKIDETIIRASLQLSVRHDVKKKFEIKIKDNPPFEDDSELWENGTYGDSEEHAVPANNPALSLAIDDALNLELISIRLDKKLLADLKKLSESEGVIYQALIRKVLAQHVNEKRKLKRTCS